MYKNKLQELCHNKNWDLPVYATVKDGPEHIPSFTTTIHIQGKTFKTSKNVCKSKESQNMAAKIAFDHFNSPEQQLVSPAGNFDNVQMGNSSHAKELQEMVDSLMNQIDIKNSELLKINYELKEKDNLLKEALEKNRIFELQIEKLRGETMRDVLESQSKDELMQLKEKCEDMETTINTLVSKERISTDELQEARQEAIRVLEGVLSRRTTFTIKRMGQIDPKPFQNMCSQMILGGNNWEEESAKLCSKWEERVQNSHWYPFKRVINQGKLVEIVDEDDTELKKIKRRGR